MIERKEVVMRPQGHSVGGLQLESELHVRLSVSLWLQRLSHGERLRGGRHHIKRREGGGAYLHLPLSCLSLPRSQSPPSSTLAPPPRVGCGQTVASALARGLDGGSSSSAWTVVPTLTRPRSSRM